MSSRDRKDLWPELARRFELACAEYERDFPQSPKPFLTQTYRSRQEQDALYAQGRTKPGKVVTNARGGSSLHNFRPSAAFDIAFRAGDAVTWDEKHFRTFAQIAKKYGLEWGGDWKSFKDLPHFQAPNYTLAMASQGKAPTFPDLPPTHK